MLYIGIDTGVHTGFAVYDSRKGRLLDLQTLLIHRAMEQVKMWCDVVGKSNVKVIFEDARQRKWYTGDVSAKAQGAGSVKRDASVWEDFLNDYGIDYWAKPPTKGLTKWNAKTFQFVTGWQGRTSDHARDAAMLVFGK